MKQTKSKVLESIAKHRGIIRECVRKVNSELRGDLRRAQDDEEFFESARNIKSMLQGH